MSKSKVYVHWIKEDLIKLHSKKVASIYILTNNVQEHQLPHTFAHDIIDLNMFASLRDEKQLLTVVLIFISLIMNDVEHLFTFKNNFIDI